MTQRIFGVHEDAAPVVTANTYPGAAWGREFVSDKGRPLPRSTTAQALIGMVMRKVAPWTTAGFGCTVSVKLDPHQLAEGKWTSRLQQLAVAVEGAPEQTGTRPHLIINHEPENNTTARLHVDGANRAYDTVKEVAPDLVVAACSMAYAWSTAAKTDVRVTAAESDIWAAQRADLYLVDAYQGKTFPYGDPGEHTGFMRWHEHMIVPFRDRLWGFGELGFRKGAKRPVAMHQTARWLVEHPIGKTCSQVLLWGTGGTENDPGWLLNDDQSRDGAREIGAAVVNGLIFEPPPGAPPANTPGKLYIVTADGKTQSFFFDWAAACAWADAIDGVVASSIILYDARAPKR